MSNVHFNYTQLILFFIFYTIYSFPSSSFTFFPISSTHFRSPSLFFQFSHLPLSFHLLFPFSPLPFPFSLFFPLPLLFLFPFPFSLFPMPFPFPPYPSSFFLPPSSFPLFIPLSPNRMGPRGDGRTMQPCVTPPLCPPLCHRTRLSAAPPLLSCPLSVARTPLFSVMMMTTVRSRGSRGGHGLTTPGCNDHSPWQRRWPRRGPRPWWRPAMATSAFFHVDGGLVDHFGTPSLPLFP